MEAAALAEPLASTVATFSRPAPLHRSQRTVEQYTEIVDKLVGDIEAGEAFQVVPSQRFEMDTDADPLDVYRMLRVTNPSPYMFFMQDNDFTLFGASPESALKFTAHTRRAEYRRLLDDFAALTGPGAPARLRALRRGGFHRQGHLSQAALWLAAALGRV